MGVTFNGIGEIEQGALQRILKEPAVYKAIFDAIPMQIVVKSLRKESYGEFLVWNKAAEDSLGIPASEAIGRRDSDFFSPEQVEFFASKDREVIESDGRVEIPAETISSRTRGDRILRTVKTPIFDEQGEVVALIAVSEDISDLQNVEIDRLKTLGLLRRITSQFPGAIYQFVRDREGTARFPYISDGIRRLTGDRPEDITSGRVNLLDRIHPQDRATFLSSLAVSRKAMTTWRIEFRFVTKEGTIRWALGNSIPEEGPDGSTIWHGFAADVTELKITSEALHRSEERLSWALRAAKAAVWEVNLHTKEAHVTSEWLEIFGYRPEERPKTWDDLLSLIHTENSAEKKQINAEIEADCEALQSEFQHRKSDGTYVWVWLNAHVVKAENPGEKKLIGTLIDISDRKRMEMELVEAKNVALRASHAKGEFLAVMSHEIRTPLNAVLGFSDLLASTRLNNEQGDFLRTIQEGSSTLLVILNDVLDYSKIESGKMDVRKAPTDLRRTINAAAEVFRPQVEAKGVKLIASCAKEIPKYLLCDRARISQILHNLMSNAAKFTKTGEITVSLSVSGPCTAELIPLLLEVEDTGIGIDLDNHPALFEPFYQADSSTRRSFGGTGLGLAIVKRLTGLMGGTIEVQSQWGKGTRFSISLPLKPAAQVHALQPSRPIAFAERHVPSGALASLKILVVEDNATNRKLVRLFLKRLGCESDEAENGFQGVAKTSQCHYDVIFMDLEMPGMDGFEATIEIRKMQESLDRSMIVALTAHAMPEHRQRCVQAGMDAYLSKPVKLADIENVLNEAKTEMAKAG